MEGEETTTSGGKQWWRHAAAFSPELPGDRAQGDSKVPLAADYLCPSVPFCSAVFIFIMAPLEGLHPKCARSRGFAPSLLWLPICRGTKHRTVPVCWIPVRLKGGSVVGRLI